MWLSKSSHTTPSATPPPSQRAYSPAPSRRPYLTPGPLPPRPGINPRSSSLSLVSPSSSTASIPTAGRVPSGSSLKYQVTSAPPPGVRDPLKVLEDILGSPPKKHSKGKEGVSEQAVKPDELIEDIDFGGLDLHTFADEEDGASQPLSNVYKDNSQSVVEYDKENEQFEDLHRSILACDEVLRSVETYLTGFQADLGAVSAEIETLQSRSTALNTKLENRKVVERLLGPAVEEIAVSPLTVRRIAEGPIDEGFVKALIELDKRSKAVSAKSKEPTAIKGLEDVKPLLENLTSKSIERIRDYIVAQIKALRSPNINAQIIQQEGFLKYKELFPFLARHQQQLSGEIMQAYINTMRWYYLNHFTRYRQALDKLKLHVIDKHDALGHEDAGRSRGALLSNSRLPTAPHDAFSLGRRIDLLRHPSHAAISSYVAEEDKSTHYLELSFHAFNLALIDNASFEYTFLTSYFSPTQSYQSLSRTFAAIFDSTFALGQALTKQLVDTTVDAFGVLLCVRLNQHFAFELQRRKVPAVEAYINATNMLLWPRFQQIIDLHCDSLRRATSALPNRPTTSTLLSSPSSQATQSTAPHPLTQKFANFLHGILALSSEAADNEPVSNSLGRLRSEFEAWLTKVSKGIADPRRRERFLGNNWSLVAAVVADGEGRLADEMKGHFAALRDAHAQGR